MSISGGSDPHSSSATSGRRPVTSRDPARIWPRLGPTLLNTALGQADLASLQRAQRSVCVPGSPLAIWEPTREQAPALKEANAAVSRLVARGARADARAWAEFDDAFHLEPAERWDALRAAALAWLSARGLKPGGQARPAVQHQPIAAQAPPRPASLPQAAAEAWSRLVPRLIDTARAGRTVESLRGICDHYAREGWDPGALAIWVPAPADLDLLLAAETLRKHLFSSPPSQQSLLASEFLAQVQQVSTHGPLLVSLAQAYLDAHRIGSTPRNRGGGGGGGGGGGSGSGRGGGRRGGRGGRGRRRGGEPAMAMPVSPIERADFVLTSDTISIYIDEVELGKAHGAIAGVVWNGAEPDHRVLSHIGTHRRSPEPLRELLGCARAFPFLVPVRGAAGAPARYLPMVRTALQLLLGWLLPLPNRPTRVMVYLERYGEYDPGDDLTPYFAGALDESRVDFPERFTPWRLAQVGWEGKSFGYIPWGDLVGYWYLARVVRGERFGGHDCTKLPGYMPVDGDGYRRIRAASRIVGTPAVEEILDVARDLGDTTLGRLVLRSAAGAVAGDTTFQERLLDELERRRRDGDPRAMRPQEAAVRSLIGEVPSEAPLRVRLLALGLGLGSGDAERTAAAEAGLATARARALLLDRELVARLDHAQAAAEADRFLHAIAGKRLESVRSDPAFPYLTPAARARLLGLHGRILAVDARHEEAEEAFTAAMVLIAEDPGLGDKPRDREQQRVACWRAMNALDGRLASAPALLTAALGHTPEKSAVPLATSSGEAAEAERSLHHLLLRSLWFHNADEAAEDAYLDAYDAWGELPAQHPGQLAGAYRAMLLWRDDADEEAVAAAFHEALAGATEDGRGPLQRLTAAAVAVAAWACVAEEAFCDLAERELAAAETVGEGYAEAAQELRAALAAVDELPEDAEPEAMEAIANRAITALPASWH
jgi:hypothetical protein